MTHGFSRRAVFACAAAVLAAVAVYLNALHNPLLYDDYRTVIGNASIEHIGNLRAILWHDVTRPIVNFSYAVDYAVWGSGPVGYHVTSVALHALNVGLLFVLVRGLTPRPHADAAAFTAAALLAVHPMMTEAVGYVSGRSEVLCATLFLLALLAGRRWMNGGQAGWATATIALWVAAMATKETAAVFPVVLAGCDWLSSRVHDAGRRRRLWTIHVPLVAVTLLAGLVRVAVLARVEYPGQVVVTWHFVLIAMDVLRRYVFLLVLPIGQAAFHEVRDVRTVFDPRALAALATVVVILGLIWRSRRAEWTVSFGALWFLLALLPSSALIVLGRGEPMAEHRVYLASCGLFLAVGAGVRRVWIRAEQMNARGGLLVGGGLAVVLAALSLDTVVRNGVWHDPVALWREAADLAPTHYRPRLLLGEALQDSGRRSDALEQFQTAIRFRPDQPDGYVKSALCLISMGRLQDARPYLLEALARDPGSEPARRALAMLDRIAPS